MYYFKYYNTKSKTVLSISEHWIDYLCLFVNKQFEADELVTYRIFSESFKTITMSFLTLSDLENGHSNDFTKEEKGLEK